MHVQESSIALSIVMAQQGEGEFEHPISFSIWKLSSAKRNYTMTEQEGLAMVYEMQKYRNYLLVSHFKLYIDHSSLKYLVNKLVLRGRICHWILLFQKYDFEVIVKQLEDIDYLLATGKSSKNHTLTQRK